MRVLDVKQLTHHRKKIFHFLFPYLSHHLSSKLSLNFGFGHIHIFLVHNHLSIGDNKRVIFLSLQYVLNGSFVICICVRIEEQDRSLISGRPQRISKISQPVIILPFRNLRKCTAIYETKMLNIDFKR